MLESRMQYSRTKWSKKIKEVCPVCFYPLKKGILKKHEHIFMWMFYHDDNETEDYNSSLEEEDKYITIHSG